MTSKRMAGPALLTDTAATKYTTPGSTKATISRILVNNPTGAPVTCTVSIGADAQATRLADAWPVASQHSLDIVGPFTLAAGEVIQASAGSLSTLVMMVNGTEEPDTDTKKRLAGPALLSALAATKYTTPAGKATTITRIFVSNPTGGAVSFTMSIGADDQGTRIVDALELAAQSTLDIEGPFTLEEGEVIQAFASSANVLVLVVNGDEEVAPPSTDFHVSTSGSDANPGTAAQPWRTLQKAFSTLTAGQVALVHAGTYREQVDPPSSGTSDSARISVRAATGETVVWKGSERITTWTDLGGGIWQAVIANTFFGSFNPYTLVMTGSYLQVNGGQHRGAVYLDDVPYVEVFSDGALTGEGLWRCAVDATNTTIKAHFGANNPNTHIAEINVRMAAIYATTIDGSLNSGVNYLELNGFQMRHFATNWSTPVGEEGPQEGAIMPNGGRGWLITRITLEDSKNVGLSLGLYTGENAEATVGWHTVSYCTFRRCGQAGIAGSHGSFASVITNCLFEDINEQDFWYGFEDAGIKLHNAHDVLIKECIIRRCRRYSGIWFDFRSQGVRISRTVIYDQGTTCLELERNHGPLLVDNSVFVGKELFQQASERVSWVHNLMVDAPFTYSVSDAIVGDWWVPHTVTSAGSSSFAVQSDRIFNNITVGGGLGGVGNFTGYLCDYNVVYDGGSLSSFGDSHSYNGTAFDAAFSITDLPNGVTISMQAETHPGSIGCPLITNPFIGVQAPLTQGIEDSAGNPITVDTDILGAARGSSPKAGPLQSIASGLNTFTLYAGADAP